MNNIKINQQLDDLRSNGIPQRLDSSQIEQILSQKCATHKEQTCDYIDLSLSTSNPWVCMICKEEFSIQPDKLVSVSQLINENEESSQENLFLTSTIIEDAELVKNVKSMRTFIDSANKDFEKYFQELKKAFDVAWDKAKNEQKVKINLLSNGFKLTLDAYKKLSKIEELKSTIITTFLSRNENQPKNQLKEFIEIHMKYSQEDKLLVQANYQEFKLLENQFSLIQPKEVQTLIGNLLTQVNMFATSNPPQIKIASRLIQSASIEENTVLQLQIESLSKSADHFRKQFDEEKKSKQESIEILDSQILYLEENIERLQLQLEEEKVLKQHQIEERLKCQGILKALQDQQLLSHKQLDQQEYQLSIEGSKNTTTSEESLVSQIISKPVSILESLQLTIQKEYHDSVKYMGITRNDEDSSDKGQIVLTCNDPNRQWVGCYLEQPLQQDEKYIINLKLSNTNSYPCLCIGLQPSDTKDEADLKLFYNEYFGGEVTEVRGGQLFTNQGEEKIGEKILQLRIHLKEYVFKIADYPKYQKVVRLTKANKRIRDDERYYLCFQLCNLSNSITILNAVTVKEFDENM